MARRAKPLHPPLISVVTNSWKRHTTLMRRLLPSISAQTYPHIEHVLVSDGPDWKLKGIARDVYLSRDRTPKIKFHVYELGTNTSSHVPDSYGLIPLLVGCWLARGEFIICVPDDDVMTPTHLADCAQYLLDEPSIGFVYTGFKLRKQNHESIIQATEPTDPGMIASPMFRASLLDISSWQVGDGLHADHKLVRRWLDSGVEYGFIDTPTFEHFADH